MRYHLLAVLVISSTIFIYAQKQAPLPRQDNVTIEYSQTLLNAGNISYWVRNDGLTGRNPLSTDAGGLYPRTGKPVIFGDGLIWVGYVQDSDSTKPRLRAGGQYWVVGTLPGRIVSPGVPQDPNDPRARVYRIRHDYQSLTDEELRLDAAELYYQGDTTLVSESDLANVRQQYQLDWDEWPVQYGAPFYDLNGNGQYDPQDGETPGYANGDQVAWMVCNDLSEERSRAALGSPSIGLEVQITMCAYNAQNFGLRDVILQRYLIINKSGFRIDSLFIGRWSDPDVGAYYDDFAGCDTTIDLGYAYSGHATDAEYQSIGLFPPGVGYTLAQGPITPSASDSAFFNGSFRSGYKNLPMTSYIGYSGSFEAIGDYDGTLIFYNALNGYWFTTDLSNPTPMLIRSGPDAGLPTKFVLSGDPVSGQGDIDGMGNNLPPGDRQMLLSSGPLTMQPGDSQEVIYALVVGEGAEAYPYAVETLRLNTRMVKQEFPTFNRALHVPPPPEVSATSFNNKVVLDWGKNAALLQEIERQDLPGNYFFEGYNVYQLPSPDAPVEAAVRIKSIDKVTPPRIILGYQKDPASGVYVYGPVVTGSDMGIQHFWEIEEDAFTGQPFVDGQTYHFAVSAYRYTPAPGVPFPVVESQLGRASVRVLNNNPGYSSLTGQDIAVTHQGLSTGEVSATVIDPAALTGHSYQVSFDEEQRWTVTDLSNGEVKLSDQPHQSGSRAFPTVDGLLVSVFGPDSTDLTGWDFDGTRWVSGVNWGGRQFFGGLDTGRRVWGSALGNDELVPLHLEFQGEYQVINEGFIGRGPVYREDLGFQYDGIGELPLAAFDVLDPDQPRRTNVLFVENDSLAPANRRWDMGWNGSEFPAILGAGERLFFMKSDYNPSNPLYSNVNLQDDADQLDILYVIWPQQRGAKQYLLAEFTMDIFIDRANTPDDYFFFTAPAAPAIPATFRLESNFPNPFNSSTTFRFQLPRRGRVTLDVYNLLGQKVARPLDAFRNEGNHQFRWDAGNLASGLYIYRLSTPFGNADGKMLLVK